MHRINLILMRIRILYPDLGSVSGSGFCIRIWILYPDRGSGCQIVADPLDLDLSTGVCIFSRNFIFLPSPFFWNFSPPRIYLCFLWWFYLLNVGKNIKYQRSLKNYLMMSNFSFFFSQIISPVPMGGGVILKNIHYTPQPKHKEITIFAILPCKSRLAHLRISNPS